MPATRKRSSQSRELIDTGRDKRFVKRDAEGKFKEVEEVGRSLAADRRRKAKTKVKPGYGDQGDQPAQKKSKRGSGKARKK